MRQPPTPVKNSRSSAFEKGQERVTAEVRESCRPGVRILPGSFFVCNGNQLKSPRICNLNLGRRFMEQKDPHGYRTKFLEPELELMRQHKIKKALDVGAGDGKNMLFLKERGFFVTGIEEDTEKVKEASPGLKIINCSIFRNYPLDDESFDLVYSYQYLNHGYIEEIKSAFLEIMRVLKQGGIFSLKISDIEQFNAEKISEKEFKEKDEEFENKRYWKSAKNTFVKLDPPEKGIPHYMFDEKSLVRELESIDFETINIRKIKWNIAANFRKPLKKE